MILGSDYEQRDIEKEVRRYTDAIEEQDDAIKKANFYKELLNNALVSYIRTISYPIFEDTIKNALNYINKKTEDNSGYKWLNRFIQEDILGIKPTTKKYVTEIILLGYSPMAYEVIFDYKKITFQLTIPMNKRITVEDIIHVNYGRTMLHWKNGTYTWEWITASYDFEGIQEGMKKFLEEHK